MHPPQFYSNCCHYLQIHAAASDADTVLTEAVIFLLLLFQYINLSDKWIQFIAHCEKMRNRGVALLDVNSACAQIVQWFINIIDVNTVNYFIYWGGKIRVI